MFAVLRREGRKEGIAGLFSRDRYELDTVSEGNIKFVVLTVRGGRRINWERTARLLGDSRTRVLPAQGIRLPLNSGLALMDRWPYRRRMLRRAAAQMLRCSAAGGRVCRVLLIDEEMEFEEEAAMALDCGGALTVASDRQAGYPSETRRIERVSLQNATEISDYSFVLAPRLRKQYADRVRTAARVAFLTAEAEEGAVIPGTMMTEFFSPLPEQYRAFLPEGVEEEAFAAALYSGCGELSLGAVTPTRCDICFNGRLAAHHAPFSL